MRPKLWKALPACAEAALKALSVEFARELAPCDRVILEGPLGAGKSTFARGVIEALRATQPAEGSPTFAIAHEYRSPRGEIAHLDLYRLRSQEEVEDAGIPSYFWEREQVVLVEWLSSHPELEAAVLAPTPGRRNWRVTLDFCADRSPDRRDVEISFLPGS